ncbi:Rha family transcriptional regulator, partial [Bartonella henselae]
MEKLIAIQQNTIKQETVQTMSSREIAELCGKRHDHVMRDIKKMLEELNAPKFGVVDFSGYYLDSKGESRPCYNLPKRECLILVSGYSTALR